MNLDGGGEMAKNEDIYTRLVDIENENANIKQTQAAHGEVLAHHGQLLEKHGSLLTEIRDKLTRNLSREPTDWFKIIGAAGTAVISATAIASCLSWAITTMTSKDDHANLIRIKKNKEINDIRFKFLEGFIHDQMDIKRKRVRGNSGS